MIFKVFRELDLGDSDVKDSIMMMMMMIILIINSFIIIIIIIHWSGGEEWWMFTMWQSAKVNIHR